MLCSWKTDDADAVHGKPSPSPFHHFKHLRIRLLSLVRIPKLVTPHAPIDISIYILGLMSPVEIAQCLHCLCNLKWPSSFQSWAICSTVDTDFRGTQSFRCKKVDLLAFWTWKSAFPVWTSPWHSLVIHSSLSGQEAQAADRCHTLRKHCQCKCKVPQYYWRQVFLRRLVPLTRHLQRHKSCQASETLKKFKNVQAFVAILILICWILALWRCILALGCLRLSQTLIGQSSI